MSVIPVLVAGWYFGVLGGLLTALISFVSGIAIVILRGELSVMDLALTSQIISEALLIILLAVVVGYHGSLNRKHRHLEVVEQSRRDYASFLALLNEITRYALEADNLSSMLKTLAHKMGELFHGDGCFIALWDEKLETQIPAAGYGSVSKKYTSFRFDPGERTLTRSVLKAGHSLVVNDINNSPHVSVKVAEKFGAKSMLGLPLIAGDTKLGAIILSFNTHRLFDQDMISRSELAARQISLAMTKVRLLESAERRVKELSGLHEISQSFGSLHNSSSEIYGLISESLARLIGARMCAVALLDAENHEIRARSPGYGVDDAELAEFQYSVEAGAEAWNFDHQDVFFANSPDEIPAGFDEFISMFKVESVIVAPLRSEGQFLGMVYAANKPEGFTDDDAHLMGIFSGQATSVIQSARLLETIRRQAQHQEALLRLSEDLAKSWESKDICRRVVTGLHETLGYDHLALFLEDETDGSRVLQASAGFAGLQNGFRIPEKKGLSSRPFVDGLLHYTPDVSKDPNYIEGMAGSEIDVPIRIGIKIGGVLVAESKSKNAFNQADFDVLTAASNLAGLALTRAKSVSVERKQFEELAILHAVAMAGTEATGEDDLIERVTSIIGQTLYPDNFGILLMDSAAGMLHPHPTYHIQAPFTGKSVRLGYGVAGTVALTGRSRCIPDVSKEPNYLAVDPNTQSELCVPIRLGDRVIGVVNAESTRLSAFSPEDERLLATLAGQLAIAIERIRTVEMQYQQAEKLARSNALISALAQVAARIERASDPEGVMQALGGELKNLGLVSLIALRIAGTQDYLIRYTSLDSRVIKKFEQIAGNKLENFRIPQERFLARTDQDQLHRPMIYQDSMALFNDVLVGFTKPVIERILRPVSLSRNAPLGHFPLMIEDRLFGFLWLWGESMDKTDLPALSIFANQVAVALENARLFAEVQNLAITDVVTGIHNRRHAHDLAIKEFHRARRYNRPLSVLVMDVDHFKRVNDTYGHAVGDRVLQSLAGLCRRSLRDIDILGRFGGEEFVFVLPETELSGAVAVAERLREMVARANIETAKGTINITVSLGVASLNDRVQELDTLIDDADRAMYEAKSNGRNRIAITA